MKNDDVVSKRLKEIPATNQGDYRKTYQRAMTGKSRKAAIKSFCLECVHWEREEIRRCTYRKCPLHPYRPYK